MTHTKLFVGTLISLLLIILLPFVIQACKSKTPAEPDTFVELNSDIKTPIVTKTINGQQVQFIIDTGANCSLINEESYKENMDLFRNIGIVDVTYHGIQGSTSTQSKELEALVDDNWTYFRTSDLSGVCNVLKQYGYNVIGILGSDYLRKNNYVIDFSLHKIYVKPTEQN